MPQQAQQDTFIITLTPKQLPSFRGWRATPALMAYRLGPGSHLFRADHASLPRGALMVVDDREFNGLGPVGPLCQEIFRECQARGFSGVILDFDTQLPTLQQIAAQLDASFAKRGLSLYVPEHYGLCAPHAQVMIPSPLSGGSLSLRLEDAVQRFGQGRVALALEKVAEDFPLPSPTGEGQPLSPQQLEELMSRLSPCVFFSGDLCARYFTYMGQNGGAHFVLFDDEDTLCRKVEVAHQAGIHTFLAPWVQVSAQAAQMGIPKKSPPGRM